MTWLIRSMWVLMTHFAVYVGMDAFLGQRLRGSWRWLAFLLTASGMCLWVNLGLPWYGVLGLWVGSLAALSVCVFRGSWQRYVMAVVLGCLMVGAVDAAVGWGVSQMLGIPYGDLQERQLLHATVIITAKLLEILLAWLLRCLRTREESQPVQSRWLLLMLLFPVASFFMVAVIFYSYRNLGVLSAAAFLCSGIITVANIVILYLLRSVEKDTKKEQEMILLHQRMELQTRNILALEKSYREQRKATHEFRNQLQTIHDLLDRGEAQEAMDYVRQLQETRTVRVFEVYSHHPIMDAVLNQKYQAARELGIETRLQVNDLSKVRIDTDGLVVLLSNLLDNAIEGCQRLPEGRKLHCSVIASERLFISIRNTSLPVTIKDGLIPTSKEPREEHGFGLPAILHILEGLGAEHMFHYEDGWFHFATEIPLGESLCRTHCPAGS